jgi:hypothetical protein
MLTDGQTGTAYEFLRNVPHCIMGKVLKDLFQNYTSLLLVWSHITLMSRKITNSQYKLRQRIFQKLISVVLRAISVTVLAIWNVLSPVSSLRRQGHSRRNYY